MVLELCRSPADVRSIQNHLERMQIPALTVSEVLRLLLTRDVVYFSVMCLVFSQGIDDDVRPSVANFKALVLALLKDPVERAYFFQVTDDVSRVFW